ncbi:hypothetical protein M569_17282, partial [Genlisea aurea]
LVNAATGTGKTLAYLAPIVHLLQGYDQRIQRSDGTFALVLVPTRELCMQVYEILQKLLHRFHWIVPGYIMGGESRSKEKARLRKGISILVATPGRLLDHLKHTKSFMHTNLRWIIFDEADRILELGYGKDIEEILDCLGSRKHEPEGSSTFVQVKRQNLLLSATLNEKVNELANISLENPVLIGLDDKRASQNLNPSRFSHEEDGTVDGLKRGDESGNAPPMEEYRFPTQLVQRFIKVPCGSRLVVLLSVLRHLFEKEASQKVVVFFSTCDSVDFHYSLLDEFHSTCTPSSETEKQKFFRCRTLRLHGKMNQEDRKTTFQSFRTENSALLLSTDVSARGLDFPKVRCIIQYDPPGEATEYVHRVGRTARLDDKGYSLLFLQPAEVDYLVDLKTHGVTLTEYPILKILNNFVQLNSQNHHPQNTPRFLSMDVHPWLLTLQRALESFI